MRRRREEPTMLDTGRVMIAMRARRMGRLRFPFVPAAPRHLTPLGVAVALSLALALAIAVAGALIVAFR